MKVKKISAKEAKAITLKLGLCFGDGQVTFYATDENESEVWEFDTKQERDAFLVRNHVRELKAEVENRFDKDEVNGFEDSAPSIKLAILADMYDENIDTFDKETAKAFDMLADEYSAGCSWN